MPRSLGMTSLRILSAIRGDVAYGLDIVQHTGMPSGTVYPTLGRLKKRGYVSARWEEQEIAEQEGRPRRRYYALTGEGRRVLAEGASRVSALASELAPESAGSGG